MFGEGDLPAWVNSLVTSEAFASGMVVVVILCGGLAWRYRGAVRAVAILFGVTALVLACNTTIMRRQIQEREPGSQRVEHIKMTHLALQTPQMIAGLQLPAGTVIQWQNEEHKDAEIELPGPSEVSGVPLVGHLLLTAYSSSGHLWQDRVLDGWPCAKGEVSLETNGKLSECTLSSDRVLPALTIPGESHITLMTNHENDVPFVETRVTLSADTELKAYGALLPAESYLTLYADGQPEEIEANAKSIRVRGLSLGSMVYWKYAGIPLRRPPGAQAAVEYVRGRLQHELDCNSVRIAVDQWVGIPATGDRIMVWSQNDALEPSSQAGCFRSPL